MGIEQLKNAFWDAVVHCLVRFHHVSCTEARARAFDLRSRAERALGSAFEPGLIYHDEPFYVASRLAGRELDLQLHRAEYDAILAQRLGTIHDVTAAASGRPAPGLAEGGW
jgi:hypothetical protein